MIATNPNLRRLDKEPITELDLVDGRQLRSGRETGQVPALEDDPALASPSISILEPIDEEEDEEEPEALDLPEDGMEEEEEEPIQKTKSAEGPLKGVNIKKGSVPE